MLKVKDYNVNQIAEIGDKYFDLICLLVNGGFNGFEERKNNFKALKATLKNIYTCTD
jgi:predicted chitinase